MPDEPVKLATLSADVLAAAVHLINSCIHRGGFSQC